MRFLTVCLCLLLALPAAAQVRKADVVALLGQLPSLPGFQKELRSYGFKGEKLKLAVDHVHKTLNDRVIANHLADRLIKAQAGKLKSAAGAQGLLQPVMQRGLTRLPTNELAYFMKVEKAVVAALPKSDCGRMIKGTLPPKQTLRATGKVAARLNAPALERYYQIYRKSTRLGATKPPRKMSANARKAALERLFRKMMLQTLTNKQASKAIKTFINLPRSSNQDACAAGLFMMDTILSSKGKELSEGLRLLAE